uniref:Uncharacterized protein n=1 Tax=Anguilla anguilla TaxID=7936 RepID=A0A0E9QH70_ANGAN
MSISKNTETFFSQSCFCRLYIICWPVTNHA